MWQQSIVNDDQYLKWLELYFKNIAVSQDCMLLLFVMIASLWMLFWEHKIKLFCFLSLTERTDDVVTSINDYVWESEDELTCAFDEGFEIWD